MNDRMYRHPSTQANLGLLERNGITVIPPGEGELASHGEHGLGRLPEPDALLEACEALLASAGEWDGLNVLVTAGGTREPIDKVRYIGNRSSGRMGFALAADAARRGARVTLVAANTSLPIPPEVKLIGVETAAELRAACEREFESSDVLLMAAAVADFRPVAPFDGKIKKTDSSTPPTIGLERTEDVISLLASRRRAGQVLVGFAAEHGERALAYGREKLERKQLDAVVVNDVSKAGVGFDTADNEVTIVSADGGTRDVPRTGKDQVARAVLDEVERLRLLRAGGDRLNTGEGRNEATRAGAGSAAGM
jgi:phosphopantothenoylcysteine decarboxylase/phosphopantothenate--cysteine ligase